MSDALETPQNIDAEHDIEVLRLLSLQQNGLSSISSSTSEDGKPVGYASLYKIDLSNYDKVAGDLLRNVKKQLKAQVDTRAEELRMELITPGSGQAMEYQEAYAESQRALAALAADKSAKLSADDYPMLNASIGYSEDPNTGKPSTDIAGEARAVANEYTEYQRAGAAIRGARLKAKESIEAAGTVADANTAYGNVKWPDLGVQ